MRVVNTVYLSTIKWYRIIYSVAVIGILFRFFHYIYNRSFWLDEMYLSSSLIKMNFWDLATQQLDYQQKAPIGYLWLVKLSVVLFGKGEMALRLVPLICGIAAIFIFIRVARHFLNPLGVLAAVGIIAFSPHLIYHSVEAKQYSTEALSTIVILFLYTRFYGRVDYKSLFLWGLWGAVVVWFSFSSIFVLAGMAGGVSLYHLIKKNWNQFFLYLITFVIWMLSFGINYFLFTSKHTDSEWLVLWFKNREGFMPGGILNNLIWLVKKAFSFFDFPMGLSWFGPPAGFYGSNIALALSRMVIIPVTLLIFGLLNLYKRDLKHLFILIFPLLLHLFATLLLVYPFYERLTVYLAPLATLLIALGIEREKSAKYDSNAGVYAAEKPGHSYNRWIVLVVILLLAGPFAHSLKSLIVTDDFGYDKNWKQRNVYMHITENYKPGDVVYVYWNGLVPYRYYNSVYDFNFKVIEGKDYRFSSKNLNDYLSKIEKDVETLKTYKRVWVVLGDNLVLNIGDFDNKPEWYYKSSDYLKRKHAIFNKLGEQKYYFRTQENINLLLYETK